MTTGRSRRPPCLLSGHAQSPGSLWLPDVYILYLGQPAGAVAVLVVMHLAIALITYNLLVRLAPASLLARGLRPGAGLVHRAG